MATQIEDQKSISSEHPKHDPEDDMSETRLAPDHTRPQDETINSDNFSEKDVNAEQDVEANAQSGDRYADAMAKEDYSVFTVPQKRAIILAGSFIAWFSPMSGSIYYPALNSIAADLHVTDSKVNITVTTYLIVQGLAPMMIAGFSDKAGRRPAYIVCFVIYLIANLALALQNDYTALLILRMVQSGGSSGTVALAQGLVGDCIVSADRGKYVAFAALGSVLGPTLSPVLGGILSQYLGWHWIFWFLLILSGAAFVAMALFLPETCRNIVGDGSIPPPWSSWNVTDHVRFKNRERKGIPIDQEKLAELRQNHRITIPNPIGTLKVLADLESALLLVSVGLCLACFYAISSGASKAFSTVYGFNDLEVSLMFLPMGGGSIVSAFTTGKMMDWNYRRHARKLGFPISRSRQTDLSNFPIEMARLQICIPVLLLGAASVIGYGWLMNYHVSLAGPIIMLFILGYCLIAGSQCVTVLLVDIYPGKAATATAANNVVRCLLGAAASAVIVPMSNAMGNGLAYTVLALLFVISSAGPAATMRYGVRWRKEKQEKAERKNAAKQVRMEQKK